MYPKELSHTVMETKKTQDYSWQVGDPGKQMV